jgi:hypothetical protein
MNATLDLLSILRLTLDALDQAIEADLRQTGSVETQKARGLADRARAALDTLAAQQLGVQRAAG